MKTILALSFALSAAAFGADYGSPSNATAGLSTGQGITPGTGTTVPSHPASGSLNSLDGNAVYSPTYGGTPPVAGETNSLPVTQPSASGNSLYRPGTLNNTNPGTPENQVRQPTFTTSPYQQNSNPMNSGTGVSNNGLQPLQR